MTLEQSFFAVFCIESLADKLMEKGEQIYKMVSEDSDIIDTYIIPNYDFLHTQGKEYIVEELITIMKKRGVL
jgi:hypothetical protein